MTIDLYPTIQNESLKDIIEFCKQVVSIRYKDISFIDNLKNSYIKGRKVDKVPTGSSDVEVSDRIGDFNFDDSYLYMCVDDSGVKWKRTALSSF